MKTRDEIIQEVRRQLAEIDQYFTDVASWNDNRGKVEGLIDADPDGSVGKIRKGLRKLIETEDRRIRIVESRTDIWKDERVIEALKDGRPPDDIAILDCPKCNIAGYYNQGSWFSCPHCKTDFSVMSEDEVSRRSYPVVSLESMRQLSDCVTEGEEAGP
jgi:hypothetical protein